MDYQVMAFDETTLTDFHDVILPNVLAELYALDDFSDYGILAVGAMQNGQAIGAAIARILNEVDVQILSLYVAPKFRREGVAGMMIDGIAALSFDLFNTVENLEVPVGICIDYVLDDEQPDGFEEFLDKAGFRHREERPPLYMLTAGCADKLSDSGSAGMLPEIARGALSEWLEETDLNSEPDLCVYVGQEEDPQCLLLATDSGDGSYGLVSKAPGACSETDFEAALKLLLQKLDRNAEVYASAERNACPDVLAKAVGYGGRIFRRNYAQRRMIIEKGEPA